MWDEPGIGVVFPLVDGIRVADENLVSIRGLRNATGSCIIFHSAVNFTFFLFICLITILMRYQTFVVNLRIPQVDPLKEFEQFQHRFLLTKRTFAIA